MRIRITKDFIDEQLQEKNLSADEWAGGTGRRTYPLILPPPKFYIVLCNGEKLMITKLGFFSGEPKETATYTPADIKRIKVTKGVMNESVVIYLKDGKKVKFKLLYKMIGLSDYQGRVIEKLRKFKERCSRTLP